MNIFTFPVCSLLHRGTIVHHEGRGADEVPSPHCVVAVKYHCVLGTLLGISD